MKSRLLALECFTFPEEVFGFTIEEFQKKMNSS